MHHVDRHSASQSLQSLVVVLDSRLEVPQSVVGDAELKVAEDGPVALLHSFLVLLDGELVFVERGIYDPEVDIGSWRNR